MAVARSGDALDLICMVGKGEEWISDALAWISIAEHRRSKPLSRNGNGLTGNGKAGTAWPSKERYALEPPSKEAQRKRKALGSVAKKRICPA